MGVLAGVVQPVAGVDPGGAHQRAVEQREVAGGPSQRPQRCGQAATQFGQHGDGLPDVAVRGGQPDVEAGGQPGVGVAVAQVRQHQQRLLAGGQLASGAQPLPVRLQQPGQKGQGAFGQGDGAGVGEQQSPRSDRKASGTS